MTWTDPKFQFSERSFRNQLRSKSRNRRDDIILDPFLGSGSTLIAADKTGRVCRGIELDPLYVDVIVRLYQAATGKAAVFVETGETYQALEARRATEVTPA